MRRLALPKQALLAAAKDYFARHNRQPHTILSIIGAKAIAPIWRRLCPRNQARTVRLMCQPPLSQISSSAVFPRAASYKP